MKVSDKECKSEHDDAVNWLLCNNKARTTNLASWWTPQAFTGQRHLAASATSRLQRLLRVISCNLSFYEAKLLKLQASSHLFSSDIADSSSSQLSYCSKTHNISLRQRLCLSAGNRSSTLAIYCVNASFSVDVLIDSNTGWACAGALHVLLLIDAEATFAISWYFLL